MADSFFSGFSCRFSSDKGNNNLSDKENSNSTFNHKQRLIQQRDDAIAYAKKCENDLKRNTEHFSIKYNELKQELKSLKGRNCELETQNKVKDRLLKEKTKDNIHKTRQIIDLKAEIIGFAGDNKPKIEKRNSCPPSSNMNRSNLSIPVLSKKANSSNCIIRKKLPSKPLPNIEKKEAKKLKLEIPNKSITQKRFKDSSIDENDDFDRMPFIHRKSSTQTSTLSAVAVNLSFPTTTTSSPSSSSSSLSSSLSSSSPSSPKSISAPTPTIKITAPSSSQSHNSSNSNDFILLPKPLQLSPICEMKSRDEYNKKKGIKTPQELIRISDDNENINNYWTQSIAKNEKTQSNQHQCNNEQLSVFDLVKTFEKDKHRKQSDHLSVDNISNISYITDNTLLFQDINMNENGNIINDLEVSAAANYSKQSIDNVDGCDVVRAPLNILCINHSLRIALNDDKQ